MASADALNAAGASVQTYCALAPEARAEVRRKLGIETQLICHDDPIH